MERNIETLYHTHLRIFVIGVCTAGFVGCINGAGGFVSCSKCALVLNGIIGRVCVAPRISNSKSSESINVSPEGAGADAPISDAG